MTIEFSYEGDVSWLTAKERHSLKKALKQCTRDDTWRYFDITSKQLSIGGSYDDEDGDTEIAENIQWVLNRFCIDWSGGYHEVEYEPDWDSMTGGVDCY